MNNKLDLPKELQLALGNTNPEVKSSLLNEFLLLLLTAEQTVIDNTITFLSVYIRSYGICSFMSRQVAQVMLTNLLQCNRPHIVHWQLKILCHNILANLKMTWKFISNHGSKLLELSRSLATVTITCINIHHDHMSWRNETSLHVWWNYINAAITLVRHWADMTQ
jgi:hypothetical protein